MKLKAELAPLVTRMRQVEGLAEYARQLKSAGGYKDYEVRLAWDALRAATPTKTICTWYDKYGATDAHITTLAKAALRQVLNLGGNEK